MTHDEEDGLQTACGIFGCVATKWPTELDVAHVICMGLTALQHRGQEGAGIVTSHGDGGPLQAHKGLGLVSQAFTARDLDRLKGNLGVGHTRYSTFGGLDRVNVQPFVVQTEFGPFASAHNGELVNAVELREEIMGKGVGLSTLSDSELITQILCRPPTEDESDGPNWPARIKNMMRRTKIAYSLLIMAGDTIYAVRDPYGNRPLCLGKLVPSPGSEVHGASRANGCAETEGDGEVLGEDDCDGYVVSSESCAFLCVAARLLREVEPGEIVEITRNGCKSLCVMPRDGAKCPSLCIFEYVYFARPDSVLEGQTVYSARKECGRQLAIHAPAVADLVSCVPESATAAALGFSEHSKIPYVEVLCKNRYVGRTFIQPSTKLRQLAVLKKFGPLTENFRGKRIVLVDDSIVRGNTIGAIIKLLKTAGASEVHIRVASPPLRHPCFMGINIPTKEELIANKYEASELAQLLGADSLVYLSVENLTYAVRKHANVNGKATGQCTACLTGNYPVLLPQRLQW